MNVNLHIERLVLDGIELTADQQPVLKASIAIELTRLLADGALAPHLSQGAALARLSAGDVELTTGDPRQLGQQIAQSVYRGIGPGGRWP